MTRLVTRLTAVAAAFALMAAGAIGVADAKTKKSSTKISIEAQQGGFFGQVKSKRESCKNERKVTLYKRRKGHKANRRKDKKIGSDIAQPNGDGVMWSINTDEQGKFYAYAKSTSKCKRGISKSVKAEEPSDDNNNDG